MATLKLEPITKDPRYAAHADELRQLETRLAAAVRRREIAVARLRGAKPARSIGEMAKDLVAGAKVSGVDPAREIEAADAETAILTAAIREKSAALADYVAESSLALCRRREISGEHTAALRRAIAGLRAAQQGFADAAAVREKVRAAGYQPLEAVLPSGMPPLVLAIGSGEGDGRQLDQYFRFVRMHSEVILDD